MIVPVYWHYYGLSNFLWLSDIGLFLTAIALWMSSPLIMSIAAVGIFAVEVWWNIDFFALLFFNKRLSGLSSYMFDTHYPIALRLASLFHIIIPVLWIFYCAQHLYDPRALYYAIPGYWIVIAATYFCADLKKENINWVLAPKKLFGYSVSQKQWLCLLVIGYPVCIIFPTHWLLRFLC